MLLERGEVIGVLGEGPVEALDLLGGLTVVGL